MTTRFAWAAVAAILCAVALGCSDEGGSGKGDGGGGAGGSGAGGTGTGGTGGAGGAGGTAIGYADPVGASGTRLRRRYFEAPGGAWLTRDFHDTELGVACRFDTAADGALRCMPSARRSVDYRDPGCTEPIVFVPDGGCDAWGQDFDRRVYRVTNEPAVIERGIVYYFDGSSCIGLERDRNGAYWKAELVPARDLVSGEVEEVAAAGDLVHRYVVGEDGSRFYLETHDRNRGYVCEFDGAGRCLPIAKHRRHFLDSGCTQPVVVVYAAEIPPVFAVTDEQGACISEYALHARGSLVQPRPAEVYVFNPSTSTCAPATIFSGARVVRLGDAIPDEEVTLARIETEGDGALVARRLVDLDGAPIGPAIGFLDTSRDEACVPAELPDGGFGCLPVDTAVRRPDFFADPSCTAGSNIGVLWCEEQPARLVVEYMTACPDDGVRRIATLEEATGPATEVYFRSWSDGSCEPAALAHGNVGYTIGGDAPDELPSLELRME